MFSLGEGAGLVQVGVVGVVVCGRASERCVNVSSLFWL